MSTADRPHLGALMWRWGHRVRVTDPEWQRESGWQPENLRKRGFAPGTVIDVGVAEGTAGLYEAFPDAYLVLVEPLAEYEAAARRILADRPGEHAAVAVGAETGTTTIRFDPARPTSSSVMELSHSLPPGSEEREIPITTLDALRVERGWQPPFGLKLDVEGAEHHVIGGATGLLEETQFVIAEVNVWRSFEGSYSFAEFIALMDSHRFRLCDVVDGVKWHTGEVAWLDLLFRKRGQPGA
jgi:FkbM family methyltransferase